MTDRNKKHPNSDLAHDERGSVSVPAPHAPHLPHIHAHVPAPLQGFFTWLKQIKPEQIIISLAILSQVLLASYLVIFMLPKTTNFAFAGNSCSNNLVLLPKLHRANSDSNFTLKSGGGLSVAGYPVASTSTCLTPKTAPRAGTESVKISSAIFPFISQNFRVETPTLPSVSGVETIKKMPTNIPVSFSLDQGDSVFGYRLSANDKVVQCPVVHQEIVCDSARLNLEQSTKYNFKLERFFAGAPVETIFEQSFSTIEAVTVESTSPKEGQTVYDKPREFIINFSKNLESFEEATLTNLTSGEIVPISARIDGKSLVVSAEKDLSRDSEFALSVSQVTAPDLSSLSKSYTLKFKTSGGPKVAGVSIGSYGVYTSSSIVLSFDSTISSSQNVSNYISLSAGGEKVDANVYLNGSKITIDPKGNLPKCSALRITVTDGMRSNYGITGGSAWSYNSRSICRSEFSIGSSVLGRSIVAYKFGSGAETIIFFGAMHGNEAGTSYTLNSWINELEAKYDQIPNDKTVVVIPSLNPDGVASGNRYNHRNVDLNRNFPDVDWQADVQVAGGEVIENNGGTAPLSEPEAAALATYVQSVNPRLILSYHAVGSVIIANETGDSTSLANIYAAQSYYWAPSASQSSGLFGYQITGTMEGWAHNVLGIPALVIEQSGYYTNEFYSQRSAMWSMVTNP